METQQVADFDIERAVAQAGSHLGSVIQKLYDGVAFRLDGKTFHIISHSGDDELGRISTADLSFAVHFMKQLGRPVGKCKNYKYDPVTRRCLHEYEPAFTFAWVGWIGC